MTTHTQFTKTKAALYSLTIVLVFFLFLEGAARVGEYFLPPIPVDPDLGFSVDSKLFVSGPGNPNLFVTNPKKTRSFHEQSFINPKPGNTFRIVAFGGSSVNYLQETFTGLAKKLNGKFVNEYEKFEIINAGGLSFGSHRLSILAKEMLDHGPDMILIYSGHNEFEEIYNSQLAALKTGWLLDICSNFALFRFLRDRRIEWIMNHKPNTRRAWRYKFTREEVENRMEIYKKNLSNIIRMYQERDIAVIIGTVPSNVYWPGLPDNLEKTEYVNTIQALVKKGAFEEALKEGKRRIVTSIRRHQSSDLENGIIRSLAEEYNIPLADVELAVMKSEPNGIPGETLFMDHCHLNKGGNEVLIRTFEERIVEVVQKEKIEHRT